MLYVISVGSAVLYICLQALMNILDCFGSDVWLVLVGTFTKSTALFCFGVRRDGGVLFFLSPISVLVSDKEERTDIRPSASSLPPSTISGAACQRFG